jgi:hypothetical protein
MQFSKSSEFLTELQRNRLASIPFRFLAEPFRELRFRLGKEFAPSQTPGLAGDEPLPHN